MDSTLKNLAVSYLQSRNNAIENSGVPEIEQFYNDQAQRTFEKAMKQGYSTTEWNEAVQKVWDQQERETQK